MNAAISSAANTESINQPCWFLKMCFHTCNKAQNKTQSYPEGNSINIVHAYSQKNRLTDFIEGNMNIAPLPCC